VGIRISSMGEPVRVVYDDRYVTREETPPTLDHFIRQRTRWSQGFLQTLMKREWTRLPTFEQRLLAIYTLAFPTFQAVLGAYVPVSLATMFTIKTPVLVAITLSLPLYLLLAHLLLSVIGLYEFTGAQQLRPSWGFGGASVACSSRQAPACPITGDWRSDARLQPVQLPAVHHRRRHLHPTGVVSPARSSSVAIHVFLRPRTGRLDRAG